MIKRGTGPSTVTYNILIGFLGKNGDLNMSLRLKEMSGNLDLCPNVHLLDQNSCLSFSIFGTKQLCVRSCALLKQSNRWGSEVVWAFVKALQWVVSWEVVSFLYYLILASISFLL